MNIKKQQHNQQLPHSSKPKDSRPPVTIKELPQHEEEDGKQDSGLPNLNELTNEEEADDEHINESLFERYDQMFSVYNNFGALFQDTAHYIGLLIRKNMLLNSQIQEIAQKYEEIKENLKNAEQSYENCIQSLAEKERNIGDIQSDNNNLRLQLDQMIIADRQREKMQLKSKQVNNQNLLSVSAKSKQVPKQQQASPYNNQVSNNSSPRFQNNGHTFESFFEIEKHLPQGEQDSCSLKDLFSINNTKKRGLEDISKDLKLQKVSQVIKKQVVEEKRDDDWITHKNKNIFKKKQEDDSQLADRFEQLSQAFFKQNNNSTQKMSQQNRMVPFSMARDSIGSYVGNNEDSASNSVLSLFNVGIKFDPKAAQDLSALKQQRLNFGQQIIEEKKEKENKKLNKKFEIQVVEQISDTLQEEFFAVKNEKQRNKGSGVSVHTNSTTPGALQIASIANQQKVLSGPKKK